MNLKQLLKPDWRKKIIFVVLFIFIYSFLPMVYVEGCSSYECHSNFTTNLDFTYKEILYFINHYGQAFYLEDWGEYIEPFWNIYIIHIILYSIITVLLSYFLSCLLVWIYDKFRKATNK